MTIKRNHLQINYNYDDNSISNKRRNINNTYLKNITALNVKECVLQIKSDTYAYPQYYNDFLVELENPLENVVSVTIKDIKFPLPEICIKEGENELTIIEYSRLNNYQPQLINLRIPEGAYTIKNMINKIQHEINRIGANFKIGLYQNNRIKIESTTEEIFTLFNGPIINFLGFIYKSYSGLTEYISNKEFKIYLYIDTISYCDPIYELDILNPNLQNNLCIYFSNPIKKLEDLIIKIKNSITKKDDLYDFNNKPYEMTLIFENTEKVDVGNVDMIYNIN